MSYGARMMIRNNSGKAIARRLITAIYMSGTLLAQDHVESSGQVSPKVVRATLILGLDGVSSNTSGELSIQDDAMTFRRKEGAAVRIPIRSIDAVYTSEEDK